MNREIKFRAWDKNRQIMLNVSPDISGGMALHENYIGFDTMFEWDEIYIPMQYTGLKDKNGVEIYEGDIVSVQLYGKQTPFEVFMSSDRWYIRNDKEVYDNGDYYFGSDIDWEDVEVIGNIFENPELIK